MPAAKKRFRNRLNNLDPKTWLKFQKSWFVHNPPPRRKDVLQHPAKFPETLAQEFIEFFTKKGQTVLDPMVGTGSTLVACLRAGRNGIGIELNPRYVAIARQIVEEEKRQLRASNGRLPRVRVLEGDAAQVIPRLRGPIDFVITSPPYWDMLHARGAETQKKRRTSSGLDVFYSDDPRDLGNIADYDEFVERLAQIYEALFPRLKPNAYLTIIVKNVKKGGRIYPLAWDLAERLAKTYTLKDERIWCLPPQEPIWTAKGLQPIGQINKGDLVLTHRGRLEPVAEVMKRHYEGMLVRIRPSLLGTEVRLTPDHEVLGLRRRQFHHANGKRFFEPFSRSVARGEEWLAAGALREGDCVAFPVSEVEIDIPSLPTIPLLANAANWNKRGAWLETRGRGLHGRGRLPAEIEINDDFLRLAGWFLSEGSATAAGVNIANRSASAREEICELFERVFGARASEDKFGVWCRSRSVAQVLAALFGRGARHKALPEFVWHLPLAKQRPLLSSLWDGDGHVGKTIVTYKTASERLAFGVAYLTIRLGAMPYIQRENGYYGLRYRGQASNAIREALNRAPMPVTHRRSHHWLRDNVFWLPIRSIALEWYEGMVHNLAVARDNSYTTAGFAVHNCQDNQRLAPYGLGSAWVSNTFHHYCLQFRKEPSHG